MNKLLNSYYLTEYLQTQEWLGNSIDVENIVGVIYKALCIINNKPYIGKTIKTFEKYKKEHEINAERGRDKLFYRAINKHGKENFEWEIIDVFHSDSEAKEKERAWIWFYNSFSKGQYGYNAAEGGIWGNVISNHPNREEICKKISVKATGRIQTEESKIKRSIALQGIPKSEEHKQKQRHPKTEKGRKNIKENHHRGPYTDEEKSKRKKNLNPSKLIGRIWVCKEKEKSKRLEENQIEEYVKQGWKIGRRANGYTSWAKGKTKETDGRLAEAGKKGSKTSLGKNTNKGKNNLTYRLDMDKLTNEIIKLRKEGTPIHKIEKTIGWCGLTIKRILNENLTKKELLELNKIIRKATNVSSGAERKKKGTMKGKSNPNYRHDLDNNIKEIKDLLKEGKTLRYVSNLFDCSTGVIRKKLKQ